MDNPVRAIVIDDEQEAIDILKALLSEIPGLEVAGEANSAADGFSKIVDLSPDLVFLDIEMPEANGFELVKNLRANKISCDIIFVTAYNQYAIQAIKYAAFDYLMKPVDREELALAVQRFKLRTPGKDLEHKFETLLEHLDHKKKIKFNTRTGYVLINPDDITYCEADGNYSIIHFINGSTEVSTMNIGKLENQLPLNFIRISRYYIINTDFLFKVDRKKHICILSNDFGQIELKIPSRKMKSLEDHVGKV